MAQTLEAKILLSAVDQTGKVFGAIAKQAASLSGNLEGIVRSTRNVGLAMTAGVTVPVVAALKSAIDTTAAFESQLADVRKVTDFSPQGFERFSEDMRDLALRLPVVRSELMSIAASAGQANIPTGEIVQFTELVAKAGVAFGITGDQAGDTLAMIKTGLELSIPQLGLLADQVNVLANSSASAEPAVLAIVREVGPFAKVAGVAHKNVAALGAAMLSMGVQGDSAAVAMRNLIINLSSGTQATADQKAAFKQLGLDVVQVAKDMQKDGGGVILDMLQRIQAQAPETRAALLNAIIGRQAVDAFGPLLGNLGEVRRLLGLIDDDAKVAGSTFREFGERSKTFVANQQLFNNALENLGTVIGVELLPSITSLVQQTTGLINTVSKSPELVKFGLAFAGIAAATGPVLFGISQTTLAVLALGRAAAGLASFVAMGPALKIVGAGMLAIGGAITAPMLAGIAAIGAAGALIYKNWEPLTAVFRGIASELSTQLAPAFEALGPIAEAASNMVAAAWGKINDTMKPEFEADYESPLALFVKSLIVDTKLTEQEVANFENVGRNIVKTAADMVKSLGNTAVLLFDIGKEGAKGLTDGFKTVIDAIAPLAKTIADTIKSALAIDLTDVGKRILQSLIDGIRSMLPSLSGILSGIGSAISNSAAGKAFSGLKGLLGSGESETPATPSLSGSEGSDRLGGDSGFDRLVTSINAALAASGHGPVTPSRTPPIRDLDLARALDGQITAVVEQPVKMEGKGEVMVRVAVDGGRVQSVGARSGGNLEVRVGQDRTGQTLNRRPAGLLGAV